METQIEASSVDSEPRRPAKSALYVTFAIMLIDIVGLSILFPISPYIVQQYSSKALMVTLMSVSYAVAQFLAAPVLGKLSDRLGRRPVILVSLFGAGVGYLIFGFAGALWVLFLSRVIAGIAGGNLSACSAYIADVSSPQELTKNMGLVGLAWGVGLVLGPAMGGFFGQLNLSAPAFISAGLALANMCVGFFLLPESLPRGRRVTAPMQFKDFIGFLSIRDVARIKGVGLMLLVLCLYNFGFNAMISTESLYFIRKFSAVPWQTGLMTMLSGATIAVIQTFFVQRLVTRLGEKRLAVASLALQAVGVLATSLIPVFGLVYLVVMLRAAAGVSIFPALNTLTMRRVSPADIGALMGVTTALGSLMNIFGPIVSGVSFDAVSPSAPYWIGTVMFLLAAGMVRIVVSSRQTVVC
jgi:MFS transporter, DHA1 family, tetracycline resistance protein